MLADLASREVERRRELVEALRTALSTRYTVERILAQGDRATVVLARDLRHNRPVAIKVLARDLVTDSGAGRFLQEIQLTARLSHPHVLPLHDSGEADGLLYYVMPFAEGETLRARLARDRTLPLPDASRLFREMADALSYAHTSGVVHRDLKPENVLLSGGHAVIADFGIAEALAAAQDAAPPRFADRGDVILGTPAYMAPEQAIAGAAVDHRADLYALGVVGYEMLTGARPFGAGAHRFPNPAPPTKDLADRGVPALLAELILQCLAEDPLSRPVSAASVVEALDGLPRTTRRPWFMQWGRVAVGVGLLGAAGVVAPALWSGRDRPALEFGPVVSLTRDPGLELHPALSPDGSRLLYSAGPIGNMKLYLRDRDGGAPVALAPDVAGNHGFPVWSPDGTRILFRSNCRFFLLPSAGGEAQQLLPRGNECPNSLTTVSWSPSGDAFAYIDGDTLFVVPLEGGPLRLVGAVPEGHSPAWSPDGRWIAVVSGNYDFAIGGPNLGNLAPSALAIVPAAGGDPIYLTDRQNLVASPAWIPDSRRLVFMSTRAGGRDLYLIRIDAAGRPAGPPARLTTGLDVATLSVASDGQTLAYAALENTANLWAIDIPDTGAATLVSARPMTRGTEYVEGVSVSPDGKWLAFDSNRSGNSDLYVMPSGGGEARRVTSDPGFEFEPDWSPDGTRLAYQSSRSGSSDVYVINVDGTGDRLVAGGPGRQGTPSWSPDGRRLAFYSFGIGQWELFVSTQDEAGTWGPPRQLTREGGLIPYWSPDGTSILYTCIRPAAACLIAPDGSGNHRFITPERFPDGVLREFSVRWASDARTVYALASDDAGLWRFWAFPAIGGSPRLLVRFDDPDRQPGRAQFATDGKTLYFTMRRRESDIKVMDILLNR